MVRASFADIRPLIKLSAIYRLQFNCLASSINSRSRKIRCDSKRPTCSNCARRSNTCVYDAVPKRRGPDKHPGTRQRRPKKRVLEEPTPSSSTAKRRRMSADEQLESQTTMTTNTKDDKDRLVDPRTQVSAAATSSLPSSGLVVKVSGVARERRNDR